MSENKEVHIKPGVPITAEDRAKLAEANAEESKRAIEQANEAMKRDIEQGKTPGVAGALTDVAGMLKGKLERNEFSVVVDDETGQHVPPRPSEDHE